MKEDGYVHVVLYPYFQRTDRQRPRPSGMFTFKRGRKGRKKNLVNQLYCSLFHSSLFVIAPKKVLISHSFFFVYLMHNEMVDQTWSWMLRSPKINYYIDRKKAHAISSTHDSLILIYDLLDDTKSG